MTGDATVEPDLAGYKFHYGAQKRGEALGAIHAWCADHEPTYDKCEAEWVAICARGGKAEPACHSMLFGYDTVIDVKNVLQYTIEGLAPGSTYFFAATAYDSDDNESNFSDELTYYVEHEKPGQPADLKQKEPTILKFEGEFPDPIIGKVPAGEVK